MRTVVSVALDNRVVAALMARSATVFQPTSNNATLLGRIVAIDHRWDAAVNNIIKSGCLLDCDVKFNDTRSALRAIPPDLARFAVLAGVFNVLAVELLRKSGLSVREFVRHAYASAEAGRVIAEACDLPGDYGASAALFHRLGSLLLAYSFPLDYREYVTELGGSRLSLRAVELRDLGTDHIEIGRFFAESCQFPTYVLQGLTDDDNRYYDIASVACNLAEQAGCTLGFGYIPPDVSPAALERLRMNETRLGQAAARVGQVVNRVNQISL